MLQMRFHSTATLFFALLVCLVALDRAPVLLLAPYCLFSVVGFAMYRAVVFTHEIAHRGEATFRRFRMVWNLLCGIPFLMPSFMYGDHKSPHASHVVQPARPMSAASTKS